MKLKGRVAELLVMLNPKLYRKYVVYTAKGEAKLYLELSKSLYGLLQSALRFYKKLVKGFKNIYYYLSSSRSKSS